MIMMHGYHAFLLGHAFSFREFTVGVVIAHCLVMSVVYNSRLAWATPGSPPPWIAKRVADSVNLKPKQKSH